MNRILPRAGMRGAEEVYRDGVRINSMIRRMGISDGAVLSGAGIRAGGAIGIGVKGTKAPKVEIKKQEGVEKEATEPPKEKLEVKQPEPEQEERVVAEEGTAEKVEGEGIEEKEAMPLFAEGAAEKEPVRRRRGRRKRKVFEDEQAIET